MQGQLGPPILIGQTIKLVCQSVTLLFVYDSLSIKETLFDFVLFFIKSWFGTKPIVKWIHFMINLNVLHKLWKITMANRVALEGCCVCLLGQLLLGMIYINAWFVVTMGFWSISSQRLGIAFPIGSTTWRCWRRGCPAQPNGTCALCVHVSRTNP